MGRVRREVVAFYAMAAGPALTLVRTEAASNGICRCLAAFMSQHLRCVMAPASPPRHHRPLRQPLTLPIPSHSR